MAKIYEFPNKKRELPAFAEEGLARIAKEYIELLYAVATIMSDGSGVTDEDMLKFSELVSEAFAKGIDKAIDEIDES